MAVSSAPRGVPLYRNLVIETPFVGAAAALRQLVRGLALLSRQRRRC
jgi:hypothetical protein